MNILITGGSKGIGRAIAEHFGTRGNLVFINYASDDIAAADCVASIESHGGRANALKSDVGTETGALQLADMVSDLTNKLDVVVHCAVSVVTGPLMEVEPNELKRCLEVNPLALVSVTRALLPKLGPGSTVIYVSSQGALSVIPNYGPLGISKALGEHIVRYLAPELAQVGIRILTVASGAIDTEAYRAVFPSNYLDRLNSATSRNLAGRALSGEDVAKAIDLLCRSEFAMTIGDRVRVDGGTNL
jgi:enoyl-[acyl-carrier protein] reductase III